MADWPKHFDGKRFFNPGHERTRGLLDLPRWKLTSRPKPSPKWVDDVRQSVPDGVLTLINHATVLLRFGGLNILTDPIWSERASPFQWIGPRRHRKPGVRREDLPPIDLVLLSHNHYDHLDTGTLRWFKRSTFVVPLGLGDFEKSSEMDWGDQQVFGNVTIDCVPAMHFSGRGLFDRDRTLWCGYLIRAEGKSIYFAGDTGFGDHFAGIRERFGAPDIALLPIGAYEPRWFMRPVHMSPHDAIEAHRVLGARLSVAIHHGTFQMADDALDQAKVDLDRAGRPESFVVLNNGESVEMP